MNSREQEKAWEALTVLLCPVLGIGAVLGMLVAVAETRLPWLALIIRVVFWGALGIGLAMSIWFEGRRFEREHGGRLCGAKSEGEDGAISAVSRGSAISEMEGNGAVDFHQSVMNSLAKRETLSFSAISGVSRGSAISGVSRGSAISGVSRVSAISEMEAFEIVCVKCGKRAISALGGEVCADCVKPINGETPC